MNYAKALQLIKPMPERAGSLTRDEIEAAISDISARMKGPLPTSERLLLHADRADLRAALDRLPQAGS